MWLSAFSLKKKGNLFTYLFLAALGLRCCVGFSLVAEATLVMVGGLLIVVPSFMVPRARVLGYVGFSSCASWALKHSLSNCGIPAEIPGVAISLSKGSS